MTKKRDLKARIRGRMERTDESYVTARMHVLGDTAPPAAAHPMQVGWRPTTANEEAQSLIDRAIARDTTLYDAGLVRPELLSSDDAFVAEGARTRWGDSLLGVAACADWLKQQLGFEGRYYAYGARECFHIVQRCVDAGGGPALHRPYATPAVFIAAAMGLGIEAEVRSDGHAFFLPVTGVASSRRDIASEVVQGRGVVRRAGQGVTFGGRWGQLHELQRFLDLDDLDFEGVVGAEDPQYGPYSVHADVPVEYLGEVVARGYRALTRGERDSLFDAVIGDVEDYSGPKHSD